MDTEHNDTLRVKMFGSFALQYKDKAILGGKRSSETQFSYLMQIMLHNRENGVSRDFLEKILFEDREIDNVHHAMQSVIYNAKKKLEREGLPKVNYIILKKGVFYWNEEIPVEEDAELFDQLYEQAEAAEDMEEKLTLYLQACHVYTGDFLSLYASILWAAQEARRYRAQFCDCVEKAVVLLRKQKDYVRMKELGEYASRISPFSDWETITMEALVSMGKHEEAVKFYADTVDLYFNEQGLRPSKRLMESLERLGSQVEHTSTAMLDTIQQELTEGEKENGRGGYLCSYPVFRGIYHMVERMMERGGQAVCLMLCTVTDSKGEVMRECALLDDLSKRLGVAICRSVRHGDAVSRYAKGQYLILLVNTTIENCEIVQRRIDENFRSARQRIGVRYYVKPVICD